MLCFVLLLFSSISVVSANYNDPRCANYVCSLNSVPVENFSYVDSTTCLEMECPRCLTEQEWKPVLERLGFGQVKRANPIWLLGGNWLSLELIDVVFRILATEVMGYTVKGRGVYLDMLDILCCDQTAIHLEVWPERLIPEDGSFALSVPSIGYSGSAGFYIPKYVTKKYPMATTINAYKYLSDYSNIFPKVGDINCSYGLKDGEVVCAQGNYECDEELWELDNCTGPYWITPQCKNDPSKCQIVLFGDPQWGNGLYEGLLFNSQVNFSAMYLGPTRLPEYVKQQQAASREIIFFWWEPDPLLTLTDSSQLMFDEEWSLECQAGHIGEPLLSTTVCSPPKDPLFKAARRNDLLRDLDLKHLFDSFLFGKSGLKKLMASHFLAGGNRSVFNASCDWVKSNYGTWKDWVSNTPPKESSTSTTSVVVIIAILVAVVALLLILVVVVQFWGKQASQRFAPKDSSVPFATLAIDVTVDLPRIRKKIAAVAEKNGCYVSSTVGSVVAIVSQRAADVYRCATHLFDRLDGENMTMAMWFGKGEIGDESGKLFHRGFTVVRALELLRFSKPHQLICPQEFVEQLNAENSEDSEQSPPQSNLFPMGQATFRHGATYALFAFKAQERQNFVGSRLPVGPSSSTVFDTVDEACPIVNFTDDRNGTIVLARFDVSADADSLAQIISAISSHTEHLNGFIESLTESSAVISFNIRSPNILHEQNAISFATGIASKISCICHYGGCFIANGNFTPGRCEIEKTRQTFPVFTSTASREVWAMARVYGQTIPSLPLLITNSVALATQLTSVQLGLCLTISGEKLVVSAPIPRSFVVSYETKPECITELKQAYKLFAQGAFKEALAIFKQYSQTCRDLLPMVAACQSEAPMEYCVAKGGPLHNSSSSINVAAVDKLLLSQQLARDNNSYSDAGLVSMFLAPPETGTDGGEPPAHITDVAGNTWVRAKAPLDEGAFAEVYLVVGPQGRLAALKCFDMESTNFRFNREEIASEVATLSKLRHNNIVGYLSFTYNARYFMLLTEYVSGGSLGKMLKNFGAMPVSIIRTFLLDILKGLCYLHSQGITHCDIKPNNMFISVDGCCKLGDFGSAVQSVDIPSVKANPLVPMLEGERVEDEELIEEVDHLRGFTLRYMAPEATQGVVTKASDIWSLGCSIIELATASPVSYDVPLTSGVAFVRFLGANPQATPEIPPTIDKTVAALARACLQRDPSRRPSAEQLLGSELFSH